MTPVRSDRFDPKILVEHIAYLLSTVGARVPFDLSAVYTRAANRVELLLVHCPNGAAGQCSSGESSEYWRALQTHVERLEPGSIPYTLALDDPSFRCALVYPFAAPGRALGALVLLSSSLPAYTDDHIVALRVPAGIIANLLASADLGGELAMAESMIVTAQAIARNPSPQQVVNVLCDHLFDEHISGCAILFNGPIREDRPDGPFDYLEIKGSWTQRHGSEIAEGVRFYLHSTPERLVQLREQRCVVFDTIEELDAVLDPFMRALVQLGDVQSAATIRLQADRRPLGALVVTSDQPHYFTPARLRIYQGVAEFLSVSAAAGVVQQQHNFVQQGRAALLDAVTDGVLMVLPDTDGARVLTVNERFAALFGVDGAEIQGMKLGDLTEKMKVPRRVQHDLVKVWNSVPVLDPSEQHGEFEIIGEQGTPCHIQWCGAPLYHEHRVMGRIFTFQDVTAARTTERLRTELLMRLSHELRTPLTSISGFAELILDGGSDELSDMAREYVAIIYHNAKRLNRVFNDLILINRANLGQLELRLTEAHLPDVIIEALAYLEPQYRERDQTVLMQLDDDLPPVRVDSDRIMQVINNLVGNAIKYSPPGSTIHIAAQHVADHDALPANAPPDVMTPCALVSIEDEGEGISRDEAEKVFLPFYRSAHAKRQKIEGTGLGLALSRSVIELHRGRIWAVPVKRGRRGGLFLFTLPTIGR